MPTPAVPASWTTQQLTEFINAVSSFPDEETTIHGAVERFARTFDAGAAAIVDSKGEVLAAHTDASAPSAAMLREAGAAQADSIQQPGHEPWVTLVERVDDSRLRMLVLARDRPDFSTEERRLAQSLVRVLGLTVRLLRAAEKERRLRQQADQQRGENMRLMESLKERRRLLERLSRIQNSIVRRHELDEVLDAIVAGAQDLLGDETVGLRLIDPEDSQTLVMVASSGVSEELAENNARSPLGVGAGGRAAAEGELVVIEDYAVNSRALPDFAAAGIRSALAAPVREHGNVVGSLVVATHRPDRSYSEAEREMLLAFAEHASLALTDARTVDDAMHEALHDSLTGLPNRTLLHDRLSQAQERAGRADGPVAVLFIDLDGFKTVNDSLGHAAGDELLVEAARRLLKCVRMSDTAARFGGDEFVVVLEDADAFHVTRVAARILEELEQPFEVRGRELLISASVGIAMSDDPEDDLLRNADLALYRAKSTGKGRTQLYKPQMHAAVVERMELESALAKALREDELALHYQPILGLGVRRLDGVEALVRWRHPIRGLLLPSDFIPIAEDGRLMVPLGRWVIRTACQQLSAWEGPSAPPLLSVNVSLAQLHDPNLRDDVADALTRSGLAPERLVLELTETALLSDAESTGERLAELKELGIRLAVDDFGTGNASLRHLARFPVDVLKIDRTFVQEIVRDGRQAAIVRSIIDLGLSLGMDVIAEGIENADQERRLIDLGCTLGQGFYLARPAQMSDLAAVLEKSATAPLAAVVTDA